MWKYPWKAQTWKDGKKSTGKCDVRLVTEKTINKSRGNRDHFHVFSARNGDAPNTVEMLIQHKLLNVSTESGANYSLMLEGVFEFVKEAAEC